MRKPRGKQPKHRAPTPSLHTPHPPPPPPRPGLAGAISRTATAPIDRLKMLLQVQESQHLTLRQGLKIMASEGSVRAYFKGNGTNALKVR